MGPTTSKFIKKYVGCEKKCECGGEDAGPPCPPPPSRCHVPGIAQPLRFFKYLSWWPHGAKQLRYAVEHAG